MEAGSFNAAISAQNSLLKVGGLIVDRKEVMFGKIDQMSREEVENRLKQLMGNEIVDSALESPALEGDGESQEEIDAMTDAEEESIYDSEVLDNITEEQEGSSNMEE